MSIWHDYVSIMVPSFTLSSQSKALRETPPLNENSLSPLVAKLIFRLTD